MFRSFIAFICFFLIIFSFLFGFILLKEPYKHSYQKIKARKVYKKINSIKNENEMWMLSYLRKIDPFVFEELILFSFKKLGCKIYHNRRYTGDGGIDGKVKIGNKIYLIQDKRYTNYINNNHLMSFNDVCFKNNSPGFFVHTGKTGQGVSFLKQQYPNITIISGKNLISLITGNYVL